MRTDDRATRQGAFLVWRAKMQEQTRGVWRVRLAAGHSISRWQSKPSSHAQRVILWLHWREAGEAQVLKTFFFVEGEFFC